MTDPGERRDNNGSGADHAPWWADFVGYEVYLRSFADSNGDGIGDLAGLTSRLDHLATSGVDVVWVTPFYPSPMADFGYDVADYCAIDPRFGTLDDLDRLVAEVHERGMRLIIDLVPNHSSSEHAWFRDALGNRDSPFRDHYLWRDPAPDGGPPNNWRSHFGGPAWTLDGATGQYYCHLFLPEQPDLNWDNPEVRHAFVEILEFWMDRGVDGFRIDVSQGLTKDPAMRDNPIIVDLPPDASPRSLFRAMRHDHDLDQTTNLDIFRDWHHHSAPRDVALLGEVYLTDPARVARYVEPGVLDLSFYFPMLHTPWEADRLRRAIDDALEHGGGRFCWAHSSHDDPRAPTRFGGGDLGRQRALALLGYTAFLPGPLFLYQGDELGLESGVVPASAAADPVAVRNADGSDGRDPVRTPMPWTPDEPNLGFSTGQPWLPIGENHGARDTVEAQAADPGSHLHAVRRLLTVRRDLRARVATDRRSDSGADVSPLASNDPALLAYRRGGVWVFLAVGRPVHVAPDLLPGQPHLAHGVGSVEVAADGLHLGADSLAVIVGTS